MRKVCARGIGTASETAGQTSYSARGGQRPSREMLPQPRRIAKGSMINKPVVLASGEWLFSAYDRNMGTASMIQALVSRPPLGKMGILLSAAGQR